MMQSNTNTNANNCINTNANNILEQINAVPRDLLIDFVECNYITHLPTPLVLYQCNENLQYVEILVFLNTNNNLNHYYTDLNNFLPNLYVLNLLSYVGMALGR